MDIKFINKDTLHIKTKEVSIVLDPQLEDISACKADVVITTNDNFDISKSDAITFDWPGEYEAKNVLVRSIATQDNADQEIRIVTMEINGINTAYIGKIDKLPSNKKLFEELSIVEVLILNSNLPTKDALDLIEEVEPKIVIVAAKDELKDADGNSEFEKLRKEIGKQEQEIEDKVTIKVDADSLDRQIDYFFLNV